MIATCKLRLCKPGVTLAGALLSLALGTVMVGAVPISWAKKGAFEACLEGSLEKWLGEQAALEVGEDPAAARLDDAAVLRWTADTMAQCRARGDAADSAAVEKFTAHMAQWRQHIYDVATEIRKKGQSD
jgi:hypothetical protein